MNESVTPVIIRQIPLLKFEAQALLAPRAVPWGARWP